VERVRDIVDGLVEAGHSVTVATDHSNETPGERQKRRRSRGQGGG
jgi:hypothetical protein